MNGRAKGEKNRGKERVKNAEKEIRECKKGRKDEVKETKINET